MHSGDDQPGVSGDFAFLFRGLSAGLSVALLTALSPHLPLAAIPAFIVGFGCVGALSLWTACAPQGEHPRLRVWMAGASLFSLALQARWQLAGAWVPPGVFVALLWLTVAVGQMLGRRIEHPGHLLFVAWVSTVADVFSVFHRTGVTHAVAESERALSVLALPFPMLGTADVVPMLGAGDIVFMGLYVAAGRKHGLNHGATVSGLSLGLALTLLCLLWLEQVVPALPFLGLGVLAMQPRARRPPPPQRRLAYAFATVLSLGAGMLLLRST